MLVKPRPNGDTTRRQGGVVPNTRIWSPGYALVTVKLSDLIHVKNTAEGLVILPPVQVDHADVPAVAPQDRHLRACPPQITARAMCRWLHL